MLKKKKLKRNHVIVHKNGRYYGRVIKIINDNEVIWIDINRQIYISTPEEIETIDYKGCYVASGGPKGYRFVAMPGIRKLKKDAYDCLQKKK